MKRIAEILKGQDALKMKRVQNVNHKPHPYTIGPRHVQYATILSKPEILKGEEENAFTCAHPKCTLPYAEHTSDEVCFLQLLRDVDEREISSIIESLVAEVGEDYIDGFAFVETDEKFRINP